MLLAFINSKAVNWKENKSVLMDIENVCNFDVVFLYNDASVFFSQAHNNVYNVHICISTAIHLFSRRNMCLVTKWIRAKAKFIFQPPGLETLLVKKWNVFSPNNTNSTQIWLLFSCLCLQTFLFNVLISSILDLC